MQAELTSLNCEIVAVLVFGFARMNAHNCSSLFERGKKGLATHNICGGYFCSILRLSHIKVKRNYEREWEMT